MKQVLPYIVVFISFSINAQVFPFKNFTTTDGLIDQHVKVVIEDDRGLLWIGTPFGVSWFDGKVDSKEGEGTKISIRLKIK